MRNGVLIIGVVALLMSLAVIGAGLALYLHVRPNTRVFHLNNIMVMASLDEGRAAYGFVEIGNHNDPYDGTLGVSLRCGDNEVSIDKMTETELVQLAIRVTRANPEGISGGRWPSGARRLYLCDAAVEVVVSNGRIMQISLNPRWATGLKQHGQPQIQMRTRRSANWVAVPFTDDDAAILFGTPSRVSDVLIH